MELKTREQAILLQERTSAAAPSCSPQGVMHRDIKPENVLLTAYGAVRLCDFGLALDLACETPKGCVGTLDYMPPEVRGSQPSDHSSLWRALMPNANAALSYTSHPVRAFWCH